MDLNGKIKEEESNKDGIDTKQEDSCSTQGDDDMQAGIRSDSKETFAVTRQQQPCSVESLPVSNDVVYPISKMHKQLSLPETSDEFQMSVATYTPTVNQSRLFLSPNESTNTLTESMHTASEGMRSSRSGITSFSGNTDFYMTPNEASFASFAHSDLSSLDRLVYYSCHSNLKLMLENENNEQMESECKENEENETKLRDMESINKVTSKGSLKSKIFKGIQKRHSSKKKPSHEHTPNQRVVNQPVQLVVKTDIRSNQVTSRVIHGILKSSVSSDSDCAKQLEPDYKIGGKKTLLIEKVSML